MKLLLLSICIATFPLTNILCGATIGVNWGGSSLVTETQSLILGSPSDSGGIRTYTDAGIPITPSAPVYTGQKFYGVLQNQTGSTPQNLAEAAIVNTVSKDSLTIRGATYDSSNPIARSITGLIYVKKEDFLNGLSSAEKIEFSAGSTLSLTIDAFVAGGTGSARMARMAVLNDGLWYLSQTYVSNTGVFSISDPTTEKWALWNPSGAPLATTPSVFTHLGSEFEGIQGIGFYFLDSFAMASTTAQPVFRVDSFQASFASIPEPSTVSLLMGVFFVVGVICTQSRRKRNQAIHHLN